MTGPTRAISKKFLTCRVHCDYKDIFAQQLQVCVRTCFYWNLLVLLVDKPFRAFKARFFTPQEHACMHNIRCTLCIWRGGIVIVFLDVRVSRAFIHVILWGIAHVAVLVVPASITYLFHVVLSHHQAGYLPRLSPCHYTNLFLPKPSFYFVLNPITYLFPSVSWHCCAS